MAAPGTVTAETKLQWEEIPGRERQGHRMNVKKNGFHFPRSLFTGLAALQMVIRDKSKETFL